MVQLVLAECYYDNSSQCVFLAGLPLNGQAAAVIYISLEYRTREAGGLAIWTSSKGKFVPLLSQPEHDKLSVSLDD